MSTPVAGVVYGYNTVTRMWDALSRPSLPGSAGLYPSDSLYPSDTLYPSGD